MMIERELDVVEG